MISNDDLHIFSENYTGPCRRKIDTEVMQERRRERMKSWHKEKTEKKESQEDTDGRRKT